MVLVLVLVLSGMLRMLRMLSRLLMLLLLLSCERTLLDLEQFLRFASPAGLVRPLDQHEGVREVFVVGLSQGRPKQAVRHEEVILRGLLGRCGSFGAGSGWLNSRRGGLDRIGCWDLRCLGPRFHWDTDTATASSQRRGWRREEDLTVPRARRVRVP